MMESDAVRIPAASRSLKAVAHVQAAEGIEFRLGLRYASGPGEDALVTTVWSDACATGEDFIEAGFAGTAPPGVATVQVLLRADCTDARPTVDVSSVAEEDDEDGGAFADLKSVSVDDVALVPATDVPAAISVDSFVVTPIGVQGATKAIALTSLDQTLISLLRVARAAA